MNSPHKCSKELTRKYTETPIINIATQNWAQGTTCFSNLKLNNAMCTVLVTRISFVAAATRARSDSTSTLYLV